MSPGPWTIDEHGSIRTPDGELLPIFGVKLVWNTGPQMEEAMANARLIAAAPDLLAALQNFVRNEAVRLRVPKYTKQAREAIAKASAK
jgi:hypothetical protein